jgi:voltage-gated potassium channel
MRLKSQIHRLWNFVQRENFHRLFLFIGIFLVISSIGITWLEPDMSIINAIWWSVVTMTTVGYGDISPVTLGGRVIAIVLMFFGIGLLGTLSATLASILVDKKIKEDRGMRSFNFENHIILCEWNYRAQAILNELRVDPQTAKAPIVLIADMPSKPIDDANLFFIQGSVNDETLKRANLAKAKTVVIVGDNRMEATARDAKAVLTTLTVESINPDVYTIVELVNEANVPHCKRAKADEIIVSNEISSGLMARATLNHGITRIVSELLSSHHGNELYKLPLPSSMIGRQFIEVFTEVKQVYQCIIVAVERETQEDIISNPPTDYQFEEGDYLIVIAPSRPQLV